MLWQWGAQRGHMKDLQTHVGSSAGASEDLTQGEPQMDSAGFGAFQPADALLTMGTCRIKRPRRC